MKPISIEFQAFGPYEKREFVDFEKLANDGLFLIDGKTGSGKTMILDAITFALYGKSSGSNRNELNQLRCSHCNPQDDTYVKFIFEEKGFRYTFERRLRMARKNLHESYSVKKTDSNGNTEELFESCKANDLKTKAEELIGLTFDQFRQVIILPQGQFEKLLTSDSSKKEEILASIFNAGMWQDIADRYYRKADARRKEIIQIKEKVDHSLSEDGCTSLEELEKKIFELEEEIKEEENTFNKAEYSSRKKLLTDKKVIANDFNTLQGYQKKLEELHNNESAIQNDEKNLELAEKAEELRKPLEEVKNACEALKLRNEEKTKAEAVLSNAKEAYLKAKEELERHKGKEEECNSNKRLKVSLETKEEIYKSINEYIATLGKAKELVEKLELEKQKAEDEASKARDFFSNAARELEAAEKFERTVRDSYLSSIVGHIASDLSEGMACPVCGSISHPKLADVPEGSADRSDVDKAEKQTKSKKDAWGKADRLRIEADKVLEDVKASAASADTEYGKAEKDVENARKNLVQGIVDYEQYQAELKRLNAEIEKYEKVLTELTQKIEDGNKAVASAENGIEIAGKEQGKALAETENARKKLQDALLKAAFEDEETAKNAMLDSDERNELRGKIKSYYTQIEEYEKLEKALSEKLVKETEPDLSAIEEELKSIEKAEKEYNEQHGKKKEQFDRLSKKNRDLSKEYKEYSTNIMSVDSNFTFAKRLRGDTGVGLQRYVLGIMFSSVIRAANEMLKNVAGGRYYLYRTSDKVGNTNQRGLDLMVMDNCGAEKAGRSVSTLSGGEKFLASLALSIGLAGIAKTGGVDIEGIFIDEGFGTLDEESISDALDILKSVQKKSGLVGIISHVELLRTTIYPQLQVKVDERKASHIEMC